MVLHLLCRREVPKSILRFCKFSFNVLPSHMCYDYKVKVLLIRSNNFLSSVYFDFGVQDNGHTDAQVYCQITNSSCQRPVSYEATAPRTEIKRQVACHHSLFSIHPYRYIDLCLGSGFGEIT